ncbi:MAG: polyphosphate polymerase domain-containing protein [Bacilli bacterium]|nr:polyphosphate polymerase domain-containing protein [Bacilli bacterium]
MEKEKIISVMKRYELKYQLNSDQLKFFMDRISQYMSVDKYGLTSIASIYFDTPDYRLINKSIEKPKYKEKLRLRGYGLVAPGKPTFLEVKRKCDGVVYKRRIALSEKEAFELITNKEATEKTQISRELEAFMETYKTLEPKYMIVYDRLAYYQDNSDLRITIDMNPRYRTNNLDLHTSMDGLPLIEEGGAILEVKVQHSVPLWLSAILSEGKIYQTSFSKVGTAHKRETAKKIKQKESVMNALNYGIKGEMKYGIAI